ncbi:hypothetical protein HRR83_002533 [Exophiala dermatitidis]|nr:hypothetical protein HRR74_002610 [Exophiala dermatitidis]KAJ4569070.1 hypothetical protein HRR81_006728 [Exophiala dermatitidis]KAJ4571908.1 hypothetical protein HRR79_003120 [Exophiala dermatitidis]KAJ4586742.1 hypothetical protein HRR82_002353 [Exophiala dermatitidis]KAJ4603476.1 hypothetical protein HRR83_002533 [Exophiala dermatitidis]
MIARSFQHRKCSVEAQENLTDISGSIRGDFARWTLLTSIELQGYEANNPNIELLRLRNFTLGKPIPDEVVVSEQGLQKIVELIGVMVPFVSPPSASHFCFCWPLSQIHAASVTLRTELDTLLGL